MNTYVPGCVMKRICCVFDDQWLLFLRLARFGMALEGLGCGWMDTGRKEARVGCTGGMERSNQRDLDTMSAMSSHWILIPI